MTRWLALAVLALALLPSEHQAQPARPADVPKAAAQPYSGTGGQQRQRQPAQTTPVLDSRKAEPEETARDRRAREIQEEVSKWTRWVGIFTGALVVATILLAGPAIWQAIIARQTMRRQLRAYVGYHNATIGWLRDGDRDSYGYRPERPGHAIAGIVIKNYGQTPAHDVMHIGGVVISEYPDPSNPMRISVESFQGAARSVMFPNDEAGTTVNHHQLTDAQWTALHEHHRFYVHGVIRYRDVFGMEHETRYRVVYPKTGIPPETGDGGRMDYCKDGNEYD